MSEEICFLTDVRQFTELRHFAGEDLLLQPWQPFDIRVLDFLNAVSEKLREDALSPEYPDVLALAFWLRKRHLEEYAKRRGRECFMCSGGAEEERTAARKLEEHKYCLGRGLVFHITPSNVPTVFAYSLAIGLLAGCVNVVRVSGKENPQTGLIAKVFEETMQEAEYAVFRNRILMVSYEYQQEITAYFSQKAAVRIIWGGDQTIDTIRRIPAHPRCQDICFADRISMAVLDCEFILAMEEQEIQLLAKRFYQDTYLMDQNACSSPSFVFWRGADRKRMEAAADRFWKALGSWTASYDINEKKAYDKYQLFCQAAQREGGNLRLEKKENTLYRGRFRELPDHLTGISGKFGLFYEGFIRSLQELTPLITEKMQTVAAAGIQKDEIAEWVQSKGLTGIDRIVSFGEAMQMELVWDGYDLIGQLTRAVSVT